MIETLVGSNRIAKRKTHLFIVRIGERCCDGDVRVPVVQRIVNRHVRHLVFFFARNRDYDSIVRLLRRNRSNRKLGRSRIEATQLVRRAIAKREINNRARDIANRHVGIATFNRLRDDGTDLFVSQDKVAVDPVGLFPLRANASPVALRDFRELNSVRERCQQGERNQEAGKQAGEWRAHFEPRSND